MFDNSEKTSHQLPYDIFCQIHIICYTKTGCDWYILNMIKRERNRIMTTKKLLCATVVLTTVLTGCSSAPVKTEKKDKTEEVSKKKTKDSKKETKKNSEKDESAKNEEKTKEAAKIAEKDTKEAQKQHAAETKKAVETTHNKDQQTNHKTESTTQKHEDKKDNKVESTASKNESSSENKPSDDKKPAGSTGNSSGKNDKPCTPKYEYVTIPAVTHVEKVLVRDAWTEPGITKWMCQGCEQLFDTEDAIEQHQQAAIIQGDYSHAGSSTITIKAPTYHPAEYENKVITDVPERKEKRQVGCE